VNDFGYFTEFGNVGSLNTNSYTEGDILYLSASSAGGLTTTAPTGTNVVVEIGTVTNKSTNQGSIHVNITYPETAVQHALAQATTVAAQRTALGVGTGDTPTFAGQTLTGPLIMPKTAGVGIKVDTASPVYGWKDLVGQIVPRTGGAPAPAFTAFRGTNLLSYAFGAGDKIDNMTFHWPHDWVFGTDVYFHVHWGHNGTAISGNLVLNWYFAWSKGYTQSGQVFNSETNINQSISTPDVATYPRWAHNISEFILTSDGGSATTLDRNLLEVDGLLCVALNVQTIPTITGSATSNLPYIFMVDVHYQSTQMATKGRNIPFYT
jgi:hypothetical protein